MPLPVHKTQAAFVNKLYRMLEDHEMQDLISWSPSGDLFSVANPTQFSKLVLPQYFKHNNWQSFVRQLNMYGFHKVNDMIHHSNITNESQAWEFRHPSFRRGGILELQNIKRKSAKGAGYQKTTGNSVVSTIATSSRLANAAENLPTDIPDDQQDAIQKHIYAMETQIRNLAQSYDKLLADTTVLKKDLARQNHMLTDIAARVKLYNYDDGQPMPQNQNGSSESAPSSSGSNYYDPPRRPSLQPSTTQYSHNQQSPWKDSAYNSTGDSAPSLRELRSVLPPPAGYTQRQQGSLPSPRLPLNRHYSKDDRHFTKDETISTWSDPYTYGRDANSGDSSEHWSQASSDKSTALSPITRTAFRPSLPARGASSPFPIKHNAQTGLGRESNILYATIEDLPNRAAGGHERSDDVNKRRRL
ncbi:Flocculation suppression protein [Umbelopsis nana]